MGWVGLMGRVDRGGSMEEEPRVEKRVGPAAQAPHGQAVRVCYGGHQAPCRSRERPESGQVHEARQGKKREQMSGCFDG